MRRAAVASLAVAVSLVAAAAAPAAAPQLPLPRHYESPAALYLQAHGEASGGYQLLLSGFHIDVPAQEGEPATTSSDVQLELAGADAAVDYYSPAGHVARDGSLESEWGARGRVAARFVPLRAHREPAPSCEGSFTIETGLLVGRLDFRGERGYARVRTRKLRATLTRAPKMRCRFPAQTKAQKSHESSRIGGTAGRHGRQLGVYAYLHPRLGTATVSAYASEHHGGVYVTRRVSAVAPLTALAIDPEAEAATLTAPPPFTGSANYRAFPGKEAGTWRGDLSVDFPGEPGVRLAGKRFEGAKLKPGECGPDSGATCIGIKALSPIGIKPALPLGARPGLFLMSE